MKAQLNHEWQDSLSDWAVTHADEISKTPYIPLGCDQQGRYVPTRAAEACTEVGAEEYESADAEVALFLLKGLCVVGGMLLCAWVMAGGLYA